jgi:hypothetical protein
MVLLRKAFHARRAQFAAIIEPIPAIRAEFVETRSRRRCMSTIESVLNESRVFDPPANLVA